MKIELRGILNMSNGRQWNYFEDTIEKTRELKVKRMKNGCKALNKLETGLLNRQLQDIGRLQKVKE